MLITAEQTVFTVSYPQFSVFTCHMHQLALYKVKFGIDVIFHLISTGLWICGPLTINIKNFVNSVPIAVNRY